ncbi:MAG: hypothetical protein KFW09_05135 [Oscillospiraceae bacterium]|nr:hypothetical protein [Oscillospiraceae bacterium]
MVSTTLVTTIAFTSIIIAFANEIKLESIEKNIVTMKQFVSTLDYIKYTDVFSLIFPKIFH